MTDLTFSPERAARGEPVQYVRGWITSEFVAGEKPTCVQDWADCHFVGLCRSGLPVIQIANGKTVITGRADLRMKPISTKKWILEFDTGYEAVTAARAASHALKAEGLPVPVVKEVEIGGEG